MLLSIKPIDNLHSIMYLLIPDAAVFHDFKHTYLHSIMYLLIHRADEVHHGSEHHLHSIMYLLILKALWKPKSLETIIYIP